MADDVREVLQAVAEGRMTPEEAAARLGDGPGHQVPRPGSHEPGGEEEGPGVPPPPPGPHTPVVAPAGEQERLRAVRIRAAARSVRVVGDPGVAEADVDGLHEASREGDVLVVHAHQGEAAGGFSFVGPQLGRLARRAMRERERVWREKDRLWRDSEPHGGRGWNWHWDWSWPEGPEGPEHPPGPDWRSWHRVVEPLVVRVNPRLAVDIDMSAGALTVTGVEGPVTVEVSAGSAALEGVRGPLDVRGQAAAVQVRGRFSEGASRVRCDAGKLSVALEPGSDVRVRATCDLGRLRVQSGEEDWHGRAGTRELVVGLGRASLTVEATMGVVDIRDEAGLAAEERW